MTQREAEESRIKALELHKKGELQQALDQYVVTLQHYLGALRVEKNKKAKERLSAAAEEVAASAEQLKKQLAEKPSSPSSPKSGKAAGGGSGGGGSGGGGGGSGAGGGGKKKDDPEDAKMKSAMEGAIVSTKPNVRWDDVAGLAGAKAALREAVVLPIKFPQLFEGKRKPWKGILMYGPPGTGKSYIASAVATECDSTFFAISSADIMSKWVGESEKLVRTLFMQARAQKPSVIFIDEVDSLCSARGSGENESAARVKTEFLVQMQGVGHDDKGILILAATNLPYQLDSAIRRRFERRIEIPLPDKEARAAMFKIHLGNTPHNIQEREFEALAEKAEGYSGSDISVLVRNALMEPVRTCQLAQHFKEVMGPDPDDQDDTSSSFKRLMPCSPGDRAAIEVSLMKIQEPKLVMPPPVSYDDFVKAFVTARPSVSQKDLVDVHRFTQEFGQGDAPPEVSGVCSQTDETWVHGEYPTNVALVGG